MKTHYKTGMLATLHASMFGALSVLLAQLAWYNDYSTGTHALVVGGAAVAAVMALVWVTFYISVVQDARAGR